jgi:hypothetical protein
MDKKELEKLINEMPFTDDEKKSLLVDLANGVSAQDILVKTKTLLATNESMRKPLQKLQVNLIIPWFRLIKRLRKLARK